MSLPRSNHAIHFSTNLATPQIPARAGSSDDDDDDDDDVDFVAPRARPAKRQRTPKPAFKECILCGASPASESHIDACIDAACPSPPSSLDEEYRIIGNQASPGVDHCENDLPLSPACPDANDLLAAAPDVDLEEWLGPELARHAPGLRRAGILSTPTMAQLDGSIDAFLKFECGITALGARKKLSARIMQYRAAGKSSITSAACKPQQLPVPPRPSQLSLGRENASNDESRAVQRKLVSNCAGIAYPMVSDQTRRAEVAVVRPSSLKVVWDAFYPQRQKGTRNSAAKFSLVSKQRKDSGSTGPMSCGARRPPRKHSLAQRVLGTSFVVDSFRAAGSDSCRQHFLTHFHADHYENLRGKTFPPSCVVLCSAVTASLVVSNLRVPRERIQVLPTNGDAGVEIPDLAGASGQGATVWLFDANHCPGAVLFLFYIWHTRRYVLHSGDCRYDASMFARHGKLSQVVAAGQLDILHLDTTYADPRFAFPPQHDVLRGVVDAARREDVRTRGRCLYFFGTYTIGKERVFLAVADALDLRIFADKRKRAVLERLGFGEHLSARLVQEPTGARVHVVSMGALSAEGVRTYAKRAGLHRKFVGAGLVILFRPTGWSFRSAAPVAGSAAYACSAGVRRTIRTVDQSVVYDVAYSEHSSFQELEEFVRWAKPCRLIPTVNAKSQADADELRHRLGHEDRPMRNVTLAP